MKTFGEVVREKRDALDMSLREFAKKLGDLSPAHISDIENGRRYPSEALLEKISQVLKVSVAELKEHDSRAPVDRWRGLSEHPASERNPQSGYRRHPATPRREPANGGTVCAG